MTLLECDSALRISVSEYGGNNAGGKEIICGVDAEEKSFGKWMELQADLHVVDVRYHHFLEVWD